jgi:hypothetical protein
MDMEPSGNLGKATFNKMRSSHIPEGIPNAGQPIFDATCLNMLALAWQQYGGKDPEPGPPQIVKPLRIKALAMAATQLGIKESPKNSNNTKYGQWYGVNFQPWCAIFVTWCFETVGGSPSFVAGKDYAYVPYIVNDATTGRNGLFLTNTPRPGDLVCYDWNDNEADHVGIFESGDPLSFTAIEGNTGPVNWSNGGEVMRQNRSVNRAHRIWFVRVTE